MTYTEEQIDEALEYAESPAVEEELGNQLLMMLDRRARILAAALRDARAAQTWISVKERLPEKFTLVLVCFRQSGRALVSWSGATPDPEITHWMPLPPPPKEET